MSFAHATLLLVLVLYPGMSLVDGIGDFRWIYSTRTPTLALVAGAVHAAGLIGYILLARQHSRLNRREARSALTERFAGQQVTLRPEILARLQSLDLAERVRRLEPEEREELNQLRELREWSAEHNQVIATPPTAHDLSDGEPDSSPMPPSSPTRPPWLADPDRKHPDHDPRA
jgi:hypothetical protein